MFFIADEMHDEDCGEFATWEEAIAELARLAALPWNEPPNQCPCTNWRNCGRVYEIVEFDTSGETWREIARWSALDISASGVRWRL